MNANEYQGLAEQTLNQDQKDLNTLLIHASLGLAGEAGEFIDHVKKYLFHGHQIDREYLVKELGDVLWYVATLATALDAPLGDVMQGNIKKLKNRYPQGFSHEASRNRKL